MPALEILIFGHPFLRKRVREVQALDEKITELAGNMIETMNLQEGVGLAAPQVNVDARLIVIDPGRVGDDHVSRPMALINPCILSAEGQSVYNEGCLSLPGIYADVKRPETIAIQFQDLKGQLHQSRYSGVEARIIQHEIDHLNGILFIDYLNPIKRWLLHGKLSRLKKDANVGHVQNGKKALTV